MQINEILSQLHSILNCKIALFIDQNTYYYPTQEDRNAGYSAMEIDGYKELEVEMADKRAIFYVDDKADINETSLNLALLFIKSQLNKGGDIYRSMQRLLSDSYNYSDVAAINSLIRDGAELHLIAIGGIGLADNKAELTEIIENSLDVKLLTEYQGKLVAAVEEQDINEACNGLYKNIMTEIFMECIIAIGGSLKAPQQLPELYELCLEAMELKKKYAINQKVLDYEGMSIYRLVASMDEGLKQSITQRIFSSKFVEILNNEMELTIEEMFKNNLNLTDTSAKLFIHRNTLLYRIDKIYKQTGFDLRRFEDSMVFKLAWLMYKEKNI